MLKVFDNWMNLYFTFFLKWVNLMFTHFKKIRKLKSIHDEYFYAFFVWVDV